MHGIEEEQQRTALLLLLAVAAAALFHRCRQPHGRLQINLVPVERGTMVGSDNARIYAINASQINSQTGQAQPGGIVLSGSENITEIDGSRCFRRQ